MYTINDLRKLLGLSTANQVRNRIEAVKDLIAAELRRGPNNQILVTDAGLSVLRRLQELYDSGLTITQASDVLRASGDINAIKPNHKIEPRFVWFNTKPGRAKCKRGTDRGVAG